MPDPTMTVSTVRSWSSIGARGETLTSIQMDRVRSRLVLITCPSILIVETREGSSHSLSNSLFPSLHRRQCLLYAALFFGAERPNFSR